MTSQKCTDLQQATWYAPRTSEERENAMHQTIHGLSRLPQILNSFWTSGNLGG